MTNESAHWVLWSWTRTRTRCGSGANGRRSVKWSRQSSSWGSAARSSPSTAIRTTIERSLWPNGWTVWNRNECPHHRQPPRPQPQQFRRPFYPHRRPRQKPMVSADILNIRINWLINYCASLIPADAQQRPVQSKFKGPNPLDSYLKSDWVRRAGAMQGRAHKVR